MLSRFIAARLQALGSIGNRATMVVHVGLTYPLAVVVQVGYAVLASDLRIEERELEARRLN
jgi:hypothetical protein